MDKHKLADFAENLLRTFERIKTISASGEIDRLCISGTDKLVSFIEIEGLKKEVEEAKQRRIDPLM